MIDTGLSYEALMATPSEIYAAIIAEIEHRNEERR